MGMIEVPVFTGIESDLEPWIVWMETYFARDGDFTDDQKLAMAWGFLYGDAEAWLVNESFETWETLKKGLLLRFGKVDDNKTVERNEPVTTLITNHVLLTSAIPPDKESSDETVKDGKREELEEVVSIESSTQIWSQKKDVSEMGEDCVEFSGFGIIDGYQNAHQVFDEMSVSRNTQQRKRKSLDALQVSMISRKILRHQHYFPIKNKQSKCWRFKFKTTEVGDGFAALYDMQIMFWGARTQRSVLTGIKSMQVYEWLKKIKVKNKNKKLDDGAVKESLAGTSELDCLFLNKVFSLGLASTQQQAAAMGLEFPGLKEVEEIEEIDASLADPFLDDAIENVWALEQTIDDEIYARLLPFSGEFDEVTLVNYSSLEVESEKRDEIESFSANEWGSIKESTEMGHSFKQLIEKGNVHITRNKKNGRGSIYDFDTLMNPCSVSGEFFSCNQKEIHTIFPVAIKNVPTKTEDKDENLESEIFDNRQDFLSLYQGSNYQYDTLRRAKYSSTSSIAKKQRQCWRFKYKIRAQSSIWADERTWVQNFQTSTGDPNDVRVKMFCSDFSPMLHNWVDGVDFRLCFKDRDELKKEMVWCSIRGQQKCVVKEIEQDEYMFECIRWKSNWLLREGSIEEHSHVAITKCLCPHPCCSIKPQNFNWDFAAEKESSSAKESRSDQTSHQIARFSYTQRLTGSFRSNHVWKPGGLKFILDPWDWPEKESKSHQELQQVETFLYPPMEVVNWDPEDLKTFGRKKSNKTLYLVNKHVQKQLLDAGHKKQKRLIDDEEKIGLRNMEAGIAKTFRNLLGYGNIHHMKLKEEVEIYGAYKKMPRNVDDVKKGQDNFLRDVKSMTVQKMELLQADGKITNTDSCQAHQLQDTTISNWAPNCITQLQKIGSSTSAKIPFFKTGSYTVIPGNIKRTVLTWACGKKEGFQSVTGKHHVLKHRLRVQVHYEWKGRSLKDWMFKYKQEDFVLMQVEKLENCNAKILKA